MKIDQDYLRQILEALEDAPDPTTDILKLKDFGVDYETDIFLFHAELLLDQSLLERADRRPGLGVSRGIDGHLSWAVLPLRLTSAGHDFIENLRNKEVWATIKSGFKGASISTLTAVSKQLAEGFAKQKVEKLLGLKP
jgi:hypothetical protein